MPLPLHIATIISISTIGMRLLKIRNYVVILVITVRGSSKMRGPIMPKQLVTVASQLIGSRDIWRICNSVLNMGKPTIHPFFNGPEVLTTSTDKANLFATPESLINGERRLFIIWKYSWPDTVIRGRPFIYFFTNIPRRTFIWCCPFINFSNNFHAGRFFGATRLLETRE